MRAVIIHVLCEGQTEQGFVEEVLKPYLIEQGAISVKSIMCLRPCSTCMRCQMIFQDIRRRIA